MNRASFLLAVLCISGCVTTGKEVTEDQLRDFKRGETTIDDVVAELGAPTSTSVTATGQRTISYLFAHSQPRPGSFVPLVGPLIGGADRRSSIVIFLFGPDGKLVNYRASQSRLGSGTGAAGGRYREPEADQPKEAPPR